MEGGCGLWVELAAEHITKWMRVNVGVRCDLLVILGARCSSVVECPFMVRWVVGPVPHGGRIELFFFPAFVPRLV